MSIQSFKFAVNGIKISFRFEQNFRIIVGCFVLTIIFGVVVNLSGIEWAIILICCAVAISLEMINSAIESVVDLATKEYKILAKKAKDFAAGAVLVFSVFSAVIGLIIFIPKIIKLFEGSL